MTSWKKAVDSGCLCGGMRFPAGVFGLLISLIRPPAETDSPERLGPAASLFVGATDRAATRGKGGRELGNFGTGASRTNREKAASGE